MTVELVSATEPSSRLKKLGINTADDLMVYQARVSSPQNQVDTLTAPRLLKYCIDHGHWSIFDMADMTVEVQTSRAISAQVVRHWSFDGMEVVDDFRFQEFSQRYAKVLNFETYEARAPHPKNRQASIDTLSPDTKGWFASAQNAVNARAAELYNEALEKGIAKECARFLLPMSASTTFYMKGTARSWIHYLTQRSTAAGAQKEHVDIADQIRDIFAATFPITFAGAFGEQK
jgi:thymidylate synthase (FAD)